MLTQQRVELRLLPWTFRLSAATDKDLADESAELDPHLTCAQVRLRLRLTSTSLCCLPMPIAPRVYVHFVDLLVCSCLCLTSNFSWLLN